MKKNYTLLLASFTTCTLFISSTSFAQSPCGNKDFENQNFINWVGQTGNNTSSSQLTWSGGFQTNGLNAPANDISAQQTIITLNNPDTLAIDPITGLQDVFMMTLAPNGGTASVRLGNTNNGAQAEGIKIQFAVTATDTVFTYQYSCVFQDPGHALLDQPGFAVNVYDQSNAIITNLSDTIYSGDPQYAFITSAYTTMGPIKYKRWSGVSINLAAYAGTTVTIEFNNFDCYLTGHFGYTYLDASCFGSYIANVWPGDADYDLNANIIDVLNLAIAYGSTGPTRTGASNNWVAQPSADWPQSFQLGANYKHSDCNGDGIVDVNDTTAISLNYGQIHPFRMAAPAYNQALPDLYLVLNHDTAGVNEYMVADIMLGTSLMPIDSIYGITYKINFDPTYVQQFGMYSDVNTSWMGANSTDMMSLTKKFHALGYADMGIARIDHNNINGSGKIAAFHFKTAPSGTSVVTTPVTLTDVYAITKTGRVVSLNVIPNSFVFDPNFASGLSHPIVDDHFSFYPNPATGTINFRSGVDVNSIEIVNMLGETMMNIVPASNESKIDVSTLAAGMYMIKVRSANGVHASKLQITH